MDLKAYLSSRREMVDASLERLLPADENGGRILEAMRYSIFAGGKRLRPILCLAGAEAVGGDPAQVMFCGCAMEMVHTYSLIHDDLPAMDDDEFRRGVPTSHMVYGEGMAVLAGDGLLTQAMVLLSDPAETAGLDPSRVLEAAQVVMRAAGYLGMVGGQAVDLASENLRPDLATVQYMHAMKTGALITASVQSGAILAGGDADQVRQLVRYGRRIGLAFQIADDLLDLEGDFDALGKTVGADQARGKMTYPAVVGPVQARSMGQDLVDQAAEIAESLGPQAAPLAELARYIMARTH
ncbi:MAG: polyprenyl synthetase family protein [Proteobacteria bacterium]|nr:polyprenyl synthetase family protein [Pseudomonadota bacterium]